MRPSVAEVGGRAVIERTGTMTGSNVDEEAARKLTRRARAAENPFAEVVATTDDAPSSSEDLASCSAQYFDCLNQFCNVLDANQKQCSCSNRLTQYKKVEDSLTQANDELNNVANQIRYVGLSADEVRSILKETEAETVLSSTTDTTQSRSMLDEIEKIIMSPESAAATLNDSGSSSLNFDLDFSGDSGAIDLEGLFGSTESFANMRGTELYTAAKNKCKPILTRCATKKADQSVIAGQYDIEVDKACLQYEAGLKKATAGVRTNIRTATQMLQKARLAVLADQNAYDAKGCVAALDACMKDDMVCGADYYKCIDPTKSAIDENGEVIPGGDVVMIKGMMKDYVATNLSSILNQTSAPMCAASNVETDGSCITYYLESKIGKIENGRVMSGFCRPVLDKCRRYTYADGKYAPDNTVVKSYMERAMTQISSAQSGIISEYASKCISDVSTCYNSQITQVNSYSGGTTLSPDTVKPILLGACRNVAMSCAYAVFSDSSDTSNGCWGTNGKRNSTNCINKLSEMFYQSMLCPANSTWRDMTCAFIAKNNAKSSSSTAICTNATNTNYINTNCTCNSGYYAYNGTCASAPVCPANSTWSDDASAQTIGEFVPVLFCKCDATYKVSNGICMKGSDS